MAVNFAIIMSDDWLAFGWTVIFILSWFSVGAARSLLKVAFLAFFLARFFFQKHQFVFGGTLKSWRCRETVSGLLDNTVPRWINSKTSLDCASRFPFRGQGQPQLPILQCMREGQPALLQHVPLSFPIYLYRTLFHRSDRCFSFSFKNFVSEVFSQFRPAAKSSHRSLPLVRLWRVSTWVPFSYLPE